MSTTFKDRLYRLPNFGREGVARDSDPFEGWNPPTYPSLPPANEPGAPVVPGFPWWIDPRMLPTPRPLMPGDPPRRIPSDQLSPSSLLGLVRRGTDGGLLGLLQDVMLENEVQQAQRRLMRRTPAADVNVDRNQRGTSANLGSMPPR